MINKTLFLSDTKDFPPEILKNLIEISLQTFPARVDELLMYIENSQFSGIIYHAHNMIDSFAELFHDQELFEILSKIHDFAEKSEISPIENQVAIFTEKSLQFLKELKEIQTEI